MNIELLGNECHIMKVYLIMHSDSANLTSKIDLQSCTMRVDNIKSFICPTNEHTNYFKMGKPLKTF